MYVIAALQFGTVFVLAAIFWARPVIEHLKGMRVGAETPPCITASDCPTSASSLILGWRNSRHRSCLLGSDTGSAG